ncbi:MAG: hypothetical protein P1U56_12045 [Saprospiraceae bacterium]|nr:hypothetical protein [Saprospiraceae bacterium]
MRVIATDISNLTDARYFAAWGVQGMAYNIDPSGENALTPAQLKEIVDWVEGPSTMIKMEGLEVPESLSETLSTLDIKSAIVGPFIDVTSLTSFDTVYRICTLEDGYQDSDHLILTFPFEVSQLNASQIEKIKNITANKVVFLDASFTAVNFDTIEAMGIQGIILKGGEEEKVGFKSYDELDDILEAIFD